MIEAAVAETLADVLFEIGRSQALKQQYKLAVQWLECARDILVSQRPEELSADAGEVRSCIMHSTVRALLKEPSQENTLKAWNIIHELEGETGDRVAVSLLKLELLTVDQAAVQDYYEVLRHIVRQIHLSDVNVRTILYHMHELRRRSARLAHNVLVEFLDDRLLTMDEIAWVEKMLVTIIWNITTSADLTDLSNTIEELLDRVAAKSSLAIGTSATHAAQIVSTSLQRRGIDERLRLMICQANVEADRDDVQPGRLQSSRHLVPSRIAQYFRQFWHIKRGKTSEVVPLGSGYRTWRLLTIEQEADPLRPWQVRPCRMPRSKQPDVAADQA